MIYPITCTRDGIFLIFVEFFFKFWSSERNPLLDNIKIALNYNKTSSITWFYFLHFCGVSSWSMESSWLLVLIAFHVQAEFSHFKQTLIHLNVTSYPKKYNKNIKNPQNHWNFIVFQKFFVSFRTSFLFWFSSNLS